MKSLKCIAAVATVGVLASSTMAYANTSSLKVTLSFWESIESPSVSGVSKNSDWWLTKAIKEYEHQHPNITINLTLLTGTQGYDAKVKAAGIAGDGPDVATLYDGGDVLSNDMFLSPLDSYLSPGLKKSLSGWDTVRANFTDTGNIYGVPYGAGYYYFVYYNKSLLKKAGINPNGAMPTSWNDLLTMASKLKAAGITPFEVGEQQGYDGAWTLAPLLSGQLGTQGIYEMYHKKLPINNSSMVKAYEAWQNLYKKGYTNPDAPSLTSSQQDQNFMRGKAAMIIDGMWVNTDFYNALKSNVGCFPVPVLNGSKYMKSLSGGPNNAYVIFKNSSHKQEAMNFIQFLTSAKIQDMMVAQDQNESSNNSGSNNNVIKNPLLKQQAKLISSGHYNLGYPFDNVMPQQLDDFWYRTNSQVFSGKLDPTTAANNLEQQFQQENP